MKEAVYKGHGQIESYPLNSALWGVISHEQRHANFNRYIASLNQEKVEQHIKLSIEFKDGYPVATKAYTEAEFHPDSLKSEEALLKIVFLNFKLSKLKEKVLEQGDNQKQILIEIANLEKELKELKKDLFSSNEIKKILSHKKEYAKFYGVYDFEKYNIPPVIIHDGLASGYLIQKHLNDEFKGYESTDYDKLYKVISKKSGYKSNINNSWQRLYANFLYFSDYLDSFSINYFKISNPNSEYFDVEINDSDEINASNYKIKIDNIAKSLIVYSKEVDDAYGALNLSGSFYLNGVEIEVETSDSLYDIAEKINWGEDTNHNEVLDYDEGEDVNSNEQLDGGTKAHGIFAYLEGNRLYLKNIETGDKKIIVEDSDNILHNLEIIAENPLNSSFYFPNVLQQGENAKYSINGKEYTSQSNIVNYKDMIISLKKVTTSVESFKVEEDLDKLYNEVMGFVSNYNYIIKLLNNELVKNNLQVSLTANVIKRGLKVAVFSDVNNIDVTKAGLSLKNDKSYLEELEVLLQKNGKLFNNSIYKRLFSAGIVSNNDETISVNKEKLLKHYKEVKNLFLSSNGVINRLKDFIKKITDENGMIYYETQKLNSSDLEKLKEYYIKSEYFSDYLNKKFESISAIISQK